MLRHPHRSGSAPALRRTIVVLAAIAVIATGLEPLSGTSATALDDLPIQFADAMGAPTSASQPMSDDATPPAPDLPAVVDPDDLTRPPIPGEEFTRFSHTWPNPDGSKRVQVSTAPRFFPDANGDWHDIDLHLVTGTGGRRRAKAAEVDVVIGRDTQDDIVKVAGSAGDVVLRHPGALPSKAEEIDNGLAVRFPGMLSGGRDVLLQLTPDGFDESVVLPDALALPTYVEELVVPEGVHAVGGLDGVRLVDASGDEIGSYANGTAWDASAPRYLNLDQAKVTVSFVSQAGRVVRLLVGVDQTWLAAPGRTFPVTVDPPYHSRLVYWTDSTSNGVCGGNPYSMCDTFVDSGATDSKISDVNVATGVANSTVRGLLMFPNDNKGTPSERKYVSSATLTLRNRYNGYNGYSSGNVYIATVASTWYTGTTWGSQPNIDGYFQNGGQPVSIPNADGSYQWDVRDALQRWLSGSSQNYGLAVLGYDAAASKLFLSGNGDMQTYGQATYGPLIDATYYDTPGTPSVTATGGLQRVDASWPLVYDGGDPQGVTYLATLVNASTGAATSTSCTSCTSAAWSSLPNDTPYYVQVSATNRAGTTTGTSSVVRTAGPPSAPTSVNATTSPGAATVTWGASASNGGTAITGYTATATNQANGSVLSSPCDASCRQATFSGLANGTPYRFGVYATNAAGTSPTAYDDESTPSAPAAPASVTATGGVRSVAASWPAPSNGGNAITSYTVTIYEEPAHTTVTSTTTCGTCTSFTFSGLKNNTGYKAGVTATNGVGTSGQTLSAAATTATVAPGGPTNVVAVGGNHSASISWQPPTDDGGGYITSYTVTPRDVTSPATLAAVNVSCGTVSSPQPCSSTTVTGLVNGHRYVFGVTATNVAGTGPSVDSNEVWLLEAPLVSKYYGAIGADGTINCATAITPDPASSGDTLGVCVKLANQHPEMMPVDSFIDALPTGYSAVTRWGIRVNGMACATSAGCTITPDSIRIMNGSIGPAGASPTSKTASFKVVATGAVDACSLATNVVDVANIYGATSASAVAVNICGGALGLEQWWSYVHEDLGPMTEAAANVASGNLVVSQTDSTPIQAHGRLAYVLRRTYNSHETQLTALPGSIGAGWRLNLGEAGDLGSIGVGSVGLSVPAGGYNAGGVTLVDEDGTRHAFAAKGLDVASGIDVSQTLTGQLATLIPNVIPRTDTNYRVCVDQTFQAPAGVHLGLWRYVRVDYNAVLNTNPCANVAVNNPLLLGFAAVRPDRLRYEFAADGHLLSVRDAAGVELRYVYDGSVAVALPLALGDLEAIYEPRSCTTTNPAGTAVTISSIPATCRAFRFHWNRTAPTANPTTLDIDDPAGRRTTYDFTEVSATKYQLTKVTNPDHSITRYGYGHCGDSSSSATDDQLCSVTDPRGNITRFAYSPAAVPVTLSPPRLSKITDRAGNVTTFAYASGITTVDASGSRRRYSAIDALGRVGVLEEGTTSGTALRKATYTWDTPSATCRKPDDRVDNNLCRLVRTAGSTSSADEDSSWLFNAEGFVLRESKATGPSPAPAVVKTWGYKVQLTSSSSTTVANDTVAGSGAVDVGGRDPSAANLAFSIVDATESLTPRGNAAGSGFAAYRTTYLVDANAAVAANSIPSGQLCLNPAAPSANTGLVCQTNGPAFDSSGTPTITRSTYDTFGQRLTSTTAKSLAEGDGRQITYAYFLDSATDLSGTTSAGGWLRHVTDQDGHFVAFGYDAAGNVVRTWDRNATAGLAASAFPGAAATPPSNRYTETAYACTSADVGCNDPVTDPFAAPWRYARSRRDALGRRSSVDVDENGNQLTLRPPRGTAAGDSSHDTVQTFDANDDVLTKRLPVGSSDGNTPGLWTWTYTPFDQQASETDPLGAVRTSTFDAVQRRTVTTFTRAPWPSDTSTVPPACRQSTSADAPVPSGQILCTTLVAYDMVDNAIQTTDADHVVTTHRFDGLHREVSTLAPRSTTVDGRTDRTYDLDGNVTDSCPPREFAAAAGNSASCTSTGAYSVHNTYDAAGRVTSTTTYRESSPGSSSFLPNTTSFTYDADGNRVRVVDANAHATTTAYDLQGRKLSETRPRDASHSFSTAWQYDPAGNVTAVVRPDALDVGTGADGPFTAGSSCTAASPCTLDATKQWSSVRLSGGAVVRVTSSQPYAHELRVAGPVTIEAGTTLDLRGLGRPGAGRIGVNGQAAGAPGGGGGGTTGTGTGGGGGGGGHATSGGAGAAPGGMLSGTAGSGGPTFGNATLSSFTTESGAGGGSGGGTNAYAGGNGGNGGGAIHITAETVVVGGTIRADGANGVNGNGITTPPNTGGGGGGGSGGTIWLTASTVDLAANALTTAGGLGGTTPPGTANGGTGGKGRVRIDATALTGGGADDSVTWGSFLRTTIGRITAYSYDALNRPVDVVQGASSPDADQAGTPDATGGTNTRTRNLYDADGNVVGIYSARAFTSSVTDPDERFLTRTDYDASGRAIATYEPRYGGSSANVGSTAQTSQCTTSAMPDVVPSVPAYPSGTGVCVTRLRYDAAGNRLEVRLPTSDGSDGRYVRYAYTQDNLLESVDAPSPASGRVTAARLVYDASGRRVRSTDAVNHQSVTAYTLDGLVASITNTPNGTLTHVESYAYDADGHRTSATNPLNQVSSAAYYSDGLVMDQVDTGGNDTRYVYDPTGKPTAVLSPSAAAHDATNSSATPTLTAYTDDDLLAAVTVPVSPDGSTRRRTTYGYDSGGRKVSQRTQLVDASGTQLTSGDGGTLRFAYTPNDRLRTETGRDGSTITTTYDADGQATRVTAPGSTVDATYYLDGLVRSVDDGTVETSYAYDGSGSIALRRLARDNNAAIDTTYAYGDAGVATSMTSALSGGQIGWTLDSIGRRVTESRPGNLQTGYGYGPDDTLASVTVTSGSTTLSTWTYTYDQLYRVTTQGLTATGAGGGTAAAGTYSYGYDAAGRLSSFNDGSGTKALTWDHNGNRLTFGTTSWTYNADNSIRTTSTTSGQFGYFPWGGLQSDGCRTHTYDSFDRLATATVATPSSTCADIDASFAYDAVGRQRLITERIGGGPQESTALHYDGLGSVLQQEVKLGDVDTYGLTNDGQAASVQTTAGSGATHQLFDDGQGSVGLAVNGSSVACTVRYDAFGSPMSAASQANPCNTGATIGDVFFEGGRRIAATGTYQFGERTYDPSKASFLTPDSFRSEQPPADLSIQTDPLAQNTYGYVNGDPLNYSDPDGHLRDCECNYRVGSKHKSYGRRVRERVNKVRNKTWFKELVSHTINDCAYNGFHECAVFSGPHWLGDLNWDAVNYVAGSLLTAAKRAKLVKGSGYGVLQPSYCSPTCIPAFQNAGELLTSSEDPVYAAVMFLDMRAPGMTAFLSVPVPRVFTGQIKPILDELPRGQTLVIGAMEDLEAGSLQAGEYTLLPRLQGDLGSRLGNWLRNRDVLFEEMKLGRPIRDATVNESGNLVSFRTRRFIELERDFLRSYGWRFDPGTGQWMPK